MKSTILYSSKNGNTQKIADAIASELNIKTLKVAKSNVSKSVT
jgi:flavodoxin